METVKKTFLELQEIDGVVAQLYTADETLRKSKFGYAYDRFYKKNYTPILTELQEAIADVRVDNALSDEKTKEVLTDKDNTRGYKYSKEGLKQVIAAERKIVKEFEVKEIEVIPYISSFVPEMTEEQSAILTGLII